MFENIEASRRAGPEICFSIYCYHEEESTSTDSDGKETTSKTDVITHRAN